MAVNEPKAVLRPSSVATKSIWPNALAVRLKLPANGSGVVLSAARAVGFVAKSITVGGWLITLMVDCAEGELAELNWLPSERRKRTTRSPGAVLVVAKVSVRRAV